MLRIIFGETEGAMHVPSWFRFNYEEEWFEDSLVAEIMADVDKSYYKGNQVIVNEELGPIPPERLSEGVQTLICIYKMPDLMYNATKCGENCAKWLVEIGRREDVTVNLRYYLPFADCKDMEIEILNENKTVYSAEDYRHIALRCV
jgi:hypothetical protein